jgi:hypothetical protein
VLLASWNSGRAAPPETPPPYPAGTEFIGTTMANAGAPDGGIVQAGCSTCGSGGCGGGCGSRPLQPIYEDGYIPAGCPSCCYAGRRPCDCCVDSCGFFGKCWAGLVECLCCPDPCYEPHYVHAANAAFFVDTVRPVTQMRWRYDAGWGMTSPDRAEFFMPRFNTTPIQVLAPTCPRPNIPGKGIAGLARKIDYEDLSLYMEGAVNSFSVYTQLFYRELDPSPSPINTGTLCSTSGFADMLIGTKTLLLDCELTQLTFQFQTFIPTGNFTQGLGTGHVSLEPSLLTSVKLAQDLYFQGQMAYWIPIGGDPNYQGNVWHNHLSFNRVLYRCGCNSMLIGTLEFNEWTVLGGNYTSPTLQVFVPPGGTPGPAGLHPVGLSAWTGIFSAGPGLRMVICNTIDFGVGTAFALTGDKWADQLVRSEFRWRY